MTESAPRAIGFVPAAPLLVPQIAAGSAHLDEELRESCRTVVRRLVETTDDAVVVAAPASGGGGWPVGTTWGFEGFGVARQPPDERPRLPWTLGIGAWLLDDVGWSGPRQYIAIDRAHAADAIATIGSTVLAVGDGSARRSEKAPGHLDERAEAFDAKVSAALAHGDAKALGTLDSSLAVELMCAGAPVWQWVVELVGETPVAESELLADLAPYGVGYFVAHWHLSDLPDA